MKIIGLTSRLAVLGLGLACLVPPVVRAEGESSEPPKVPAAEVSKRVDDLQKEIERLQSEWIASGQVDLRVDIGSYPAEERQVTRLLQPLRA